MMKIIQMFVHQRNGDGPLTKYGLGDDEHVYVWDYDTGSWKPDWDTRSEEQKEHDDQAVAQQFHPHRINRQDYGI